MAANFSTGRVQANPGAVLKALRAQRGWTLTDVSEKTGLPVSTLSKVENGKMDFSFEKLVRISEGLQIDIAELIGPGASEPIQTASATRRSITRAGEGKSIEMRRGNYLYVAADLLNKRIVPIVGDVFCKDIAEYGEFLRHPGEEYVYVLEGTLDLYTEFYTPARLSKGDSVYFDSSMGHAYIAVGDEPCKILSICATSEADLEHALEGSLKIEATRGEEPVKKGARRKKAVLADAV